MARRSSGEEEKDSSRARETRPTSPDQGVERPIWQEPRPTERVSVPDTDPAGIIVPDFKEGADDAKADRETGVSNPDQDKESPDGPQSESKPRLPNEDDPDPVDAQGGKGDPAGLDVGPISREGSDDEDVDPAGIIVPEFKEGADEGDPAAVIWPQFKEGPESVDTETEDADWADEDAETEVDVDVETDEDVDTFEEVEDEDE